MEINDLKKIYILHERTLNTLLEKEKELTVTETWKMRNKHELYTVIALETLFAFRFRHLTYLLNFW